MKISCWTIFIIIFTISCSEKTDHIQFGKGADYPDQESWGVTIILTDSSIERARVQSGHLEKYNEAQYIMLDQIVKVDFFDKNQNHVAILNSLEAEVNQKTNDMKAIGDVVAISDSGITLYTDTLFWNAKKEKMHSRFCDDNYPGKRHTIWDRV